MIDFFRGYRLIRDWMKIKFISESEFNNSISKNYDAVHDQLELDESYVADTLRGYSENSSLLNILLREQSADIFSVVDFGGGLGKGFYELDPDMQENCRSWQIVEKREFIKRIPKQLFDGKICFSDSIQKVNFSEPCFRVGYSNSGIQYSGRIESVVSGMAKLGTDLFVFERIPLCLSQVNRPLYVRQRSALKSNYTKKFIFRGPRVFYNFELLPEHQFVKFLQDLGFSVRVEETARDVFCNLKYRIGLFNIIAKRKMPHVNLN